MIQQTSGVVDALRSPALHGEGVADVAVVETHISYLFLTGKYVYKLKKPIRLGFLDYSTIENRLAACKAELQINRRLAPDTYLGIVAIGRDDQGQWNIGGNVQAEDWLVWMRQLPADRCLSEMIPRRSYTARDVTQIVRLLSEFYLSLEATQLADYCDRFYQRIVDNRDELLLPGHRLPTDLIGRGTAAQLQFLFLNQDLVQQRVIQGHVVEGHGDLRAEHVYLTDPPVVIDGIEFSRDLRTIDTADELSFFAMTCDLLGASDIGRQVIQGVCEALQDRPDDRLLDFYRCYRACVRAKVAALRCDQAPEEEASARQLVIRHLQLACEYSQRLGSPFALIVRGLSGTGKSTLAQALADRTGAVWLSTDAVRKELAQSARSVDYSEQARQAVYKELLERAKVKIQSGLSVVLDGTFQNERVMDDTISALQQANLPVRVITCVCPPGVALARIGNRNHSSSLSDANEAVYAQQVDAATALPASMIGTEVDTTLTLGQQLDQLRKLLGTREQSSHS